MSSLATAVLKIQAVWRGALARREAEALREMEWERLQRATEWEQMCFLSELSHGRDMDILRCYEAELEDSDDDEEDYLRPSRRGGWRGSEDAHFVM